MNVAGRVEGPGETNVLGEPLQPCSSDPLTGFYRTGYCSAGPDNASHHLVCIEVTAPFLDYSKAAGNDLTTPRPEFAFRGLKPGERWCLVAERWAQDWPPARPRGFISTPPTKPCWTASRSATCGRTRWI